MLKTNRLATDNDELVTPLCYGHDAFGGLVVPHEGWEILPEFTIIVQGDEPFDIYAGWLNSDYGLHHSLNKYQTACSGRWTTWQRKLTS